MKYICHDCGCEIPDDMDFCPHCGCLRSKSTPVDDNGMPTGVCPQCGSKSMPGDLYCGSCGAQLPKTQMLRPVLRKNGAVALALGLIPGFFNIFGLGHFVMRSWSKGCMFLAMSIIMLYVNGWSLMSSDILMVMLSVMVYFYQAMDLMRAVYSLEGS